MDKLVSKELIASEFLNVLVIPSIASVQEKGTAKKKLHDTS